MTLDTRISGPGLEVNYIQPLRPGGARGKEQRTENMAGLFFRRR
jgi:hypothetical protein